MTTATTDDRVAEALRGDEDALHELVAHWLPTVYGWCNRLGAADPQEAATDVLLILVRRHARINGPDHLPAWLYTTTRRVVANQNKKAWWRRWLPGVALERWASPDRTDAALDERELAARVER
ncbi:MAG: sigma factor, partial [Myxococcota bacterium]